MTLPEMLAVIEAYDELVDRLAENDVVRFFERGLARIVVRGEVAFVAYPNAGSDYGDPCIDREESREFPTKMLVASDAEVASWKKECERRDAIAHKKLVAEHRLLLEQQEREELTRLQSKYGK